jgi:hypothetical protein
MVTAKRTKRPKSGEVQDYCLSENASTMRKNAKPAEATEHVIMQLKPISSAATDEQRGNDVVAFQELSNFVSQSAQLDEVQEAAPANHVSSRVVLPELAMNDVWPSQVTCACFWDCHPFHTPPVSIPSKCKGEGEFHGQGCFCSLECAAAFLLHSNELGHLVTTDVYHLLNRLGEATGHGCVVRPAPSRFLLKMFGGNLDIDEFRGLAGKQMDAFPLPYPMIAVTQYMEELKCGDPAFPRTPAFIPLDDERVERAKRNISSKAAERRG